MAVASSSARYGATAYGPAGNVDTKYETRNPVARRLVNGFLHAFDDLTARSGASRVLDVGCGEGVLSCRLGRRGCSVFGVDVSETVIDHARARWAAAGAATAQPGQDRPEVRFAVNDLYALDPARHRAPLVTCCEVLEHVPDPATAMARLVTLSEAWLLLSVPREPVWRFLNMARGRYLGALGNTPGHVQHWSQRGFLTFLAPYLEVVAVRAPLPWTMVLGRPRHQNA